MDWQKKSARIIIALLTLSILLNIAAAVDYLRSSRYRNLLTETTKNLQQNEKILVFMKLFVDKVLRTGTEVVFEDRLKLENAVRNIGDQEIFSSWQQFVDSKSDGEAQKNLRSLFGILVDKINTQQDSLQ